MSNSTAYEAAYETHNIASSVFRKATDAFRAADTFESGKDAFNAAQAVFATATEAFDVAFAAETA